MGGWSKVEGKKERRRSESEERLGLQMTTALGSRVNNEVRNEPLFRIFTNKIFYGGSKSKKIFFSCCF